MANCITGKSLDTASNFDIMSRWLDICDKSHAEMCPRFEPTQNWDLAVVPSRLLNIDEDLLGSVKLIDTLSLAHRPNYAALSHCWGTRKLLTTTNGTIMSHRQGITISNLPQSFQDAITICRRLKINYIWIDSLCIVQDDEEDWDIESAKMGAIYKFSYVTIAASRAENSWEGFLHQPCAISNDRASSGRTMYCEPREGFILGYRKFSPLEADSHSPLRARGWVMQERYLSPRTIAFTDEGILWSCCTIVLSDTGHDRKLKPGNEMMNIIQSAEQYVSANESPTDGNTLADREFGPVLSSHHHEWYQMVERFSKCNLTKSATDFQHYLEWPRMSDARLKISTLLESGKPQSSKDWHGLLDLVLGRQLVIRAMFPHGHGHL